MAFISSGYNPDKPMENRITDIGPKHFSEFYPPVIKNNKGKWLYHEILEPGIIVHVAESGDELYTIRCGGCRLMSVSHIREICEIADKHCDGYLRFTTRNNTFTPRAGFTVTRRPPMRPARSRPPWMCSLMSLPACGCPPNCGCPWPVV